jgi:hypothetical protein
MLARAPSRKIGMTRQREPWGGELHLPAWLRRRKNRAAPGDTPERARERGSHHVPGPAGPAKTPGQNALDLMGTFKIMMPPEDRRRR